jgi:hypothetical protein
VVCNRWYVVRVQSADLHRYHDGVLAQDAFPYLSPEYRELLISGTCPDCWDLLVVDPITHPTAYN